MKEPTNPDPIEVYKDYLKSRDSVYAGLDLPVTPEGRKVDIGHQFLNSKARKMIRDRKAGE